MKKTVINLTAEVQSERLKSYALERANGDLRDSNTKLVNSLDKAVQMLLICEQTIDMLAEQCDLDPDTKAKIFAIIDKPSNNDKQNQTRKKYPWGTDKNGVPND